MLLIHTFGVLSSIKDVLETNSKLVEKVSALLGVEPTEQTRCGVCGIQKAGDDVERCRLRAR